MKKLGLWFFLVAFFGLGAIAEAAFTPLSVNIVPPVQFPPEDFNITGLRASLLWGEHRSVYGIDLGVLGNVTNQEFVGLSASGLFNITRGTTNVIGLQLAGLWNDNKNKTSVYGLQLALGMNRNDASSVVNGLQFALVNLSSFTEIRGFQVGLYNSAQDVYGFQIGLVNYAKSLHGVQIGLVNFNNKGPFEISPILNIGF